MVIIKLSERVGTTKIYNFWEFIQFPAPKSLVRYTRVARFSVGYCEPPGRRDCGTTRHCGNNWEQLGTAEND